MKYRLWSTINVDVVSLFVTNILSLAIEIVQLVRALVAQPNNLTLVSRTHRMEGKS